MGVRLGLVWLVGICLLIWRVDQTSAHIARFLEVKKADVSICERAHHIGLKLMACDSETLLLGYHEVHAVLEVKHVPNFDDTITTTARHHIVLIKLVDA